MDFGDFYSEQRDQILRLCWLATLDRGDAADAAQEALTRAWQRWDDLESTDPAAWTRTVALNLCRNRWRRVRRQRLDAVVPDVPVVFSVSDQDLLEALRRLSRRQREAVILFYWLDLDVAGCADAMGVSGGSVKQHLSRARATLGTLLAPGDEEEVSR
ncbi:MAG: sigma-70 family RNA polymerase sigma factor [Acidimicrobiales bacterium]|nr:sigma-70 family RNA polymerase sigma factor [Acidimicrobiales bacterium]